MKKGLYFIISVLVSASVYAGDPPKHLLHLQYVMLQVRK